MNKTTVELGLITVCLLAISVLPTSQGQPTPSMDMREVFKSKNLFVNVEYLSATTAVLRAEEDVLLKSNGTMIPFWNAIDIVKQYGYSLDEITTSGMGSEGNPTRFYAVMSKP
jgi:hypothetical protein